MTRPTSGQTWPRWSGGGGGGGGSGFPISAPDVPNAFDDEFITDPLDSKWTAISSASGCTVETNRIGTWLSNRGFGNGIAANELYRIRQAITGYNAGTAFTLYGRFSLSGYPSATSNVRLLYGDNTTYRSGNYVELNAVFSTANIVVEAYTGSSEATATLPLGTGTIYFAIRRKASNIIYTYWSLDGITWRLLWGDSTRNWNFSYLWVSLGQGTSGTYESICMCDFVRVDDSRLYLPSRA